MQEFTKRVISVILSIPKGKVMTYGNIAKVAGNSRGARQVARILHSMSHKYNLPWHRVVNAKGEISFRDEELFQTQKITLESEGITFLTSGKIDLNEYLFQPKLE